MRACWLPPVSGATVTVSRSEDPGGEGIFEAPDCPRRKKPTLASPGGGIRKVGGRKHGKEAKRREAAHRGAGREAGRRNRGYGRTA